MKQHERIAYLIDLHEQLAHAIQTGVALEMQQAGDVAADSPKHLRVGVNMAMCNNAAIAGLLLEKGIFTEEEYWNSVVTELRKEKARYEKRLGVSLA